MARRKKVLDKPVGDYRFILYDDGVHTLIDAEGNPLPPMGVITDEEIAEMFAEAGLERAGAVEG